ncbi:MAG: hypothetical protein FD143_3738, partial [Ignavibacteria bacterium]
VHLSMSLCVQKSHISTINRNCGNSRILTIGFPEICAELVYKLIDSAYSLIANFDSNLNYFKIFHLIDLIIPTRIALSSHLYKNSHSY